MENKTKMRTKEEEEEEEDDDDDDDGKPKTRHGENSEDAKESTKTTRAGVAPAGRAVDNKRLGTGRAHTEGKRLCTL